MITFYINKIHKQKDQNKAANNKFLYDILGNKWNQKVLVCIFLSMF